MVGLIFWSFENVLFLLLKDKWYLFWSFCQENRDTNQFFIDILFSTIIEMENQQKAFFIRYLKYQTYRVLNLDLPTLTSRRDLSARALQIVPAKVSGKYENEEIR